MQLPLILDSCRDFRACVLRMRRQVGNLLDGTWLRSVSEFDRVTRLTKEYVRGDFREALGISDGQVVSLEMPVAGLA
jgi:hypothetical protein